LRLTVLAPPHHSGLVLALFPFRSGHALLFRWTQARGTGSVWLTHPATLLQECVGEASRRLDRLQDLILAERFACIPEGILTGRRELLTVVISQLQHCQPDKAAIVWRVLHAQRL
jgi:hypothetical protein